MAQPSTGESDAPSAFRAWCFYLAFSWQRLARARLMVWVSLGLLALFTLVVFVNYSAGRFNFASRRAPAKAGTPPAERMTNGQNLENIRRAAALPWNNDATTSVLLAVSGAVQATHDVSEFYTFSNWTVFFIFATFLMPLWSLAFATEGLGRPREVGNLPWLLVRPLPRSAIFLANFLAALPWCLALNVGGLWVLCLAAGSAGERAFALYWPAVLWGTFAFASLFHLMGAWLRRPALAALLYSMFLESIAGNLPRHFKRLSISFYMRCSMFDSAHDYGIHPENPEIYVPVSGATATWVLAAATVGLFLIGLRIFTRREYHEVS